MIIVSSSMDACDEHCASPARSGAPLAMGSASFPGSVLCRHRREHSVIAFHPERAYLGSHVSHDVHRREVRGDCLHSLGDCRFAHSLCTRMRQAYMIDM